MTSSITQDPCRLRINALSLLRWGCVVNRKTLIDHWTTTSYSVYKQCVHALFKSCSPFVVPLKYYNRGMSIREGVMLHYHMTYCRFYGHIWRSLRQNGKCLVESVNNTYLWRIDVFTSVNECQWASLQAVTAQSYGVNQGQTSASIDSNQTQG